MRTALIAGASGLVGSYVLEHTLADPYYASVTVITRKPISKIHPNFRQILVNFDELDSLDPEIFAVTDVFSCLGTTTLSRAGDPTPYRRIEVDYPSKVAAKALAAGAKSVHYVSAIGSSSKSLLPYSKMKGDAEDALRKLQAQYPESHVAAYRPSFIKGPRKEVRLLEEFTLPIWSVLGLAMFGPLRRFKVIHAETIAMAMIRQSSAKPGFFIIENEEIERLGSI